jgi:anti-anti-sigma factor
VTQVWVKDAPLAGAPGVAVRGEVDMANATELQAALDAALADGAGVFVVDLTEVAFLDSSGINVLLRARALLGRAERELVLICPAGSVLRVLEIVRLVDLIPTFPTREGAARHLVPARLYGNEIEDDVP